MAGRGAGKTRSGAEWVRAKVKAGCGRIGLIAPTSADARDVMVEGESGILRVCWDKDRTVQGDHLGRPTYEPSKRRLSWGNGAVATLFSAEEPDRLRGPQHDALWCDELAAWQKAQETWDMAMFGLRLGDNPQVMVSTTPRPIPIVRELLKSPTTVITRASTYANRANLADTFVHKIISKYEGTRLGRQELAGELIEDVEGALWTRELIERSRIDKAPDIARVVVAVDPATTSTDASALTGIVVVGQGRDRRGYVLEDASGRYTPGEWASKVMEVYDRHKADRIVAEGNQGGDMVRHTIQTIRPNAPVTIVHASHAKYARAEPVAALYEQGKVSHVGAFPELEDQMATWEPMGDQPSPDRLDALVWGLTSLSIESANVVYTTPIADLLWKPFPLPEHWPRAYAVHIDHKGCSAVWGVEDPETKVLYLYGEHSAPGGQVAVHADSLRTRGRWLPCVFDPQAGSRAKADGEALAWQLTERRIDVYYADSKPENDILDAASRISGGRFKVFETCSNWISEYGKFSRDEKGKPNLADCPLMACTSLLVTHGMGLATTESVATKDWRQETGWSDAGRSSVTGY